MLCGTEHKAFAGVAGGCLWSMWRPWQAGSVWQRPQLSPPSPPPSRQDCPEHVRGCKPGMYISRDRWGKVGGLTQTEQRTHFAFWCIMAAPLILGNDPRAMSKATLEVRRAGRTGGRKGY